MNTLRKISTLTLLLATLAHAQLTDEVKSDIQGAKTITAESWPFEVPKDKPAKVVFEEWRANQTDVAAEKSTLESVVFPARGKSTMTRITGMIHPPVSGNYAFLLFVPGQRPTVMPDHTELWIQNATTGEWRLAQTSGNPIKRSGRTSLEKGIPCRFELWTMGKASVSLQWEVRDWDPVAKGPKISLPIGVVPASAITQNDSSEDDQLGTGLSDKWKAQYGLARNKSNGSNGIWGDPDHDGLANWQELAWKRNPTKADCEGTGGLVRWELWREIPGNYVFDLRRDSQFPTGARETRFLDRLEIPSGNGDHTGSRLRGLLVAPKDGEYTFHVTADDSAELWLGTNAEWQTKRLIASTDQRGVGRVDWSRHNEAGDKLPLHPEQSATVTLKAGQKYYLEILHKQSHSNDYCAVAWVVPGAEKPEIITRQNLVSWKQCPTDTDDDGLPDAWQRANGLLSSQVPGASKNAEADADLDGISNRDEWLASTDPLDPGDFPLLDGMLTCETWSEITGHDINSILKHPNYPAKPTHRTHIDNFDFRQVGNNYAVRLRGYLSVPEDDVYSFSIAGNNAAILYLSDSQDKFRKRIFSQVEVGTGWRSFTSGGNVTENSMRLERGKKYYIELVFKRGEDAQVNQAIPDHSSVAWTRTGRSTTIIPSVYFSPYVNDSRDKDDDDLPDEFEKLHGLDASDSSGNNGAWGDPDADGLENFREFQRGQNPKAKDVHGQAGLALWESWAPFENLLNAHRDGDGMSTALWADQRYPLSPSRIEWRDALDAPRRQGKNFGARLRAQIVVPADGNYQFSIAGRDVGELYLSSDHTKFKRRLIASFRHGTSYRSWDARDGQMSQPIALQKGQVYYIEAIYARGPYPHGDDFFSIGWKVPGTETYQIIGANHIIAFHRDPNDQDDDDLPDDFETRYDLDATNPRGDHGPLGDPDRDSFSNEEELRRGTNPNNRDTDGDGISDYDEIHTYRTNPLVKDTIPPKELISFPLSSANVSQNTPWIYGDDGSITSTQRRGALSFEFDLEKPGVYAVTLVANSTGLGSHVPAIPVSVSVNGKRIGADTIPSTSTSRTWITPYLSPGHHTVVVENHNTRANVGISIQSLTLSHFEPKETDGNGIPEWLAATLALQNCATTLPSQSAVSPCFIEGRNRFATTTSASAADQTIPIIDHMTGRWYGNVPLSADGKATKLDLHFENGAQKQSHEITWVPTNLATAPSTNHLRLGDSIRVTAHDANSKTFSLRYGDKTWKQQAASQPILITFDKPGSYILTATWGRKLSTTVTYHIHQADLGEPPAVAVGSSRAWSPPSLPAPLVLEAEEGITVTPKDSSPTNSSSQTYLIGNATTTSGSRGIAARLPGNGAILAHGTINSFLLSPGSKTGDTHLVGTLPDGTRIVEVSYIIDGPAPADLSIWIRLYVTDAVFANGLTWLQLTADDFNENGEARFRVLKAPGTGLPYVCHWILPYADFQDVLNLRQPN